MRVSGWMMAAVLLGGSTMTMRAQTSSTVKDDLFAGTEKFAANASSVTEVDMDPDSMNLVDGHNSSRARRTVLSVVHTYSYDKPGMYNMADVDAFRNKLNTGDWHCSVHVRELKSGESTDVCQKHRTDGLQEQAIITVEPKELTFIHTIKRPATTDGKPGGGDSFLTMPSMELGMPVGDGMPAAAWAAEMRAQAAEMQAEAMIARAKMGGLPGFRMNLFGSESIALGDGVSMSTYPEIDTEQMREMQRELKSLPKLKQYSPWMQPAPPAVPKVPKTPAPTPAAPAAPQAPSPA